MPSMSLAQFIGHVATFQPRLNASMHKAFERVGRIVEAEAKREVGTYQGAAGPFVAWAELADATKSDRVRQGFTENDPGLRSGEMQGDYKHASDHTGAAIGSDNDKAVWFELGTDTQPPRSVLGTATIHKEVEIKHALGAAAVAALVGHGVHGGALAIPQPP